MVPRLFLLCQHEIDIFGLCLVNSWMDGLTVWHRCLRPPQDCDDTDFYDVGLLNFATASVCNKIHLKLIALPSASGTLVVVVVMLAF